MTKKLTELEADILQWWLQEATRGRANRRVIAEEYLKATPDIAASQFASAVDALEAFGLVTPTRAWGGHVYRVCLTPQALILGREDQGGPTIHNTVHNTMIGSLGGQQTVHEAASATDHATDGQEGTRTLLDRDTGTDATTASG